jgi:hypothetical protein
MAGRNLGLFDAEFASLIQMPEQPTAKLYRPDQVSLDLRQPIPLDPDTAFHGVKYGIFAGRGVEIRVRLEKNFYQTVLARPVARKHCLGQDPEQVLSSLIVFGLSALELALRVSVAYELADTFLFSLRLILRDRLAAHRLQAIEVALSGFNHPFYFWPSRNLLLRLVGPVTVIIRLGLQLPRYDPAQKFPGGRPVVSAQRAPRSGHRSEQHRSERDPANRQVRHRVPAWAITLAHYRFVPVRRVPAARPAA